MQVDEHRLAWWFYDGTNILTKLNQPVKLIDNQKLVVGTGDDGSFYFDGTDMIITSAAGNLKLTPNGNVAFGTHSAIAAETVTGFITIKDAGGTTRKIGVVS
jgi:hypothetical protein